MSDYVGLVLDHSKTISSARVLMIAVAYCTEWQEGDGPTRIQLLPMVNVSEAELDRLISICVSIGELSIIRKIEGQDSPDDEIVFNADRLGGAS